MRGGQPGCPLPSMRKTKKYVFLATFFLFPMDERGATRLPPSHPCGKQKSVCFRQRFFFSPWMRGGQPSCPPNDTKSQKSKIFQWLRKTTQPTKIETLQS